MTCNVGKGDKWFRMIVGLVIGILGIYFQSWLGLIGIVPLLTGLINFCPLYAPFKINTGFKKEEPAK
jgi:hypothetical protein